MIHTWYIITYISYGEHHDKEAYCVKEAAYRRYEQLCNCPAASKVKIRESKSLRQRPHGAAKLNKTPVSKLYAFRHVAGMK